MAGIDVVIPAGGRIDEEFAKVVGVTSKSLITFNGKTVLRNTIEALRGNPRIGRIVLVGSEEICHHEDAKLADAILPDGGSGPKNIWAGAQHLQTLDLPPDKILIVTGDLPYLKSSSIDGFLDLCDDTYEFNVPLIAKVQYDEAFPGSEATFVRLLDGYWTTGCMYYMSVRGLKIALEHIEKVFERRKSKLGMARLLGAKFVWDYLLKKLTVSDIEAKVTQLLNVRGRAIPGCPPELAFDIDYQDDYHYVLSSLKARPMGVVRPEAEETPS